MSNNPTVKDNLDVRDNRSTKRTSMESNATMFATLVDQNPHQIALWDYSIRVPLDKKDVFRSELPKWKKHTNDALEQEGAQLRVTDIYEVLIGPQAGSIEIRWNIVKLAELEDPIIGPIIGAFDAKIRAFLDPNHMPSGRVLGWWP